MPMRMTLARFAKSGTLSPNRLIGEIGGFYGVGYRLLYCLAKKKVDRKRMSSSMVAAAGSLVSSLFSFAQSRPGESVPLVLALPHRVVVAREKKRRTSAVEIVVSVVVVVGWRHQHRSGTLRYGCDPPSTTTSSSCSS
jgi:hypothetical protein